MALIPAKASLPKIFLIAAARSFLSSIFPRLSRILSIVLLRLLVPPSLSFRLILYFFMVAAILSVGAAMLAIAVFNDRPAIELFTLAFAINPRASEVSSILYPIDPATGATYLNDSPSMLTLVLALADACANTSEKCAESFAFKPKAVSASVTISEVIPRSSPDAAASDMIPEIPFNIWFVFQPAIAMYSNACPDSTAVNLVVAPISFALSVRRTMSLSLALAIAPTVDIWASNSEPISIDFFNAIAPAPAIAAAAIFVVFFILVYDRCKEAVVLSQAAFKEGSTFPLILIFNSVSLATVLLDLPLNLYKFCHRQCHQIFQTCT